MFQAADSILLLLLNCALFCLLQPMEFEVSHLLITELGMKERLHLQILSVLDQILPISTSVVCVRTDPCIAFISSACIGNSITEKGAVSLAKCWTEGPGCSELCIADNRIGDDGFCILINAMESSHNLCALNAARMIYTYSPSKLFLTSNRDWYWNEMCEMYLWSHWQFTKAHIFGFKRERLDIQRSCIDYWHSNAI